MSEYETIRVERHDDLLWVRLDQPGRANALSPAMLGEWAERGSGPRSGEPRPPKVGWRGQGGLGIAC